MCLNDSRRMDELMLSVQFVPTSMYTDCELNTAINYVSCLEHERERILATQKYSRSDLFYGEYYWYTKFLVRYETLYGTNGGMRQRQFKMIEAMEHSGILDCSRLEQIERALGDCDGY